MAEKKKKKKKANWMVSYSAKLDSRTKQHTKFGVSASNGSRDMAPTKVAEKKKMNIDNPIKHPLRGSLNIGVGSLTVGDLMTCKSRHWRLKGLKCFSLA